MIAAAKQLSILLAWPEPRLEIPGPDRDQTDEWEMQCGIKSRVIVCMERYGLNEDQALERIKTVAEQEEKVKAILPQELTPPASETMPSAEQDQRNAEQTQQQADIAQADDQGPDPTKASD